MFTFDLKKEEKMEGEKAHSLYIHLFNNVIKLRVIKTFC